MPWQKLKLLKKVYNYYNWLFMKCILFILLFMVLNFSVIAQKNNKVVRKNAVETTIKKPKTIWAYWGSNSSIGDKTINKASFDSLIRTPLLSIDSNNKNYNVEFYDMVFAERNLYEDSVGNAIIVPDYSSYNNKGAVMNESHLNYIINHAKIGDTLFVNDIIVKDEMNQVFKLKSFKLTIKK